MDAATQNMCQAEDHERAGEHAQGEGRLPRARTSTTNVQWKFRDRPCEERRQHESGAHFIEGGACDGNRIAMREHHDEETRARNIAR